MLIANNSIFAFVATFILIGFSGMMVSTASTVVNPADSTSVLIGPSGAGSATVPSTVGFRFSTSRSFIVTHLSFYDEGSDGLNEPHTIGLWDPQQNLIVSATIPSGTLAPLSSDGFWRLVDIVDFELPSGNDYVVAATFSEANGDPLFTDVGPTIAGVTDHGGHQALGPTLTYPDLTTRIRRGWGSTGIFVAVPEPSMVLLFGLGSIPAFLCRRRERRSHGR